eukprot:gene25873-31247_t
MIVIQGASHLLLILLCSTFLLASAQVTNFPKIFGASLNDRIGLPTAVCDINRDGFPEVLISAGGSSIRVLYGGANVGITDYDLLLLPNDPSKGFILTLSSAASSSETLSRAFVACGDVNGDGINDLLVTASARSAFTLVRSFYVLYGRTAPFPSSVALDTAAANVGQGFRITVSVTTSVASGFFQTVHIADVNKDGIGDMIFRTWDSSSRCTNNNWATVILLGTRNARTSLDFSVGLATTTVPAADFVYLCSTHIDSTATIFTTGDINNDGNVDLVIGVPNEAGTVGLSEYVYTVFGPLFSRNRLSLTTGLTGSNGFAMVLDSTLTSTAAARFGSSIAVTDINGDSFDDIIIGTSTVDTQRGRVFIVFGKAAAFAALHTVGSSQSTPGFTTTQILNGVNTNGQLGANVAAIGDINQDGLKDFAVSLNGNYGSTTARGFVFVYFGRLSAWPTSINLPQTLSAAQTMTEGFCVAGATTTISGFGSHISAGDVNSDGKPDFVVGAPTYALSPLRDVTTRSTSNAGAVLCFSCCYYSISNSHTIPYYWRFNTLTNSLWYNATSPHTHVDAYKK